MCGIGGVFLPNGGIAELAGLRRMGATMEARGPDDEGYFAGPGIGLVHRRLSILDLSPLGNCPMPNEDGSIQALLNGEIYNWRELREALVARGHHFRSMSDSEVLSHGYEEWGDGLLERMRGMFALAIWDQERGRLLLARDRMGEKPLFIRRESDRVLFASTIAALLAYDESTPTTNPDAIVCYLTHTFIPASHTIWKGVEVFPPAHYAVVDRDCNISMHRYWGFPSANAPAIRVSAAEREVERVLDDSVQRCLDADVPVGVFLSGGVDSSIVAALAARHRSGLRSFTIGFDEEAWSEAKHARKVAEHLGLDHSESVVRPRDVLRVLPRLVWHYGQPFGDASAVPTYIVSALARQHVKVCLSGDGGDESFGGYWRIQSGLYSARYGAVVPTPVRQHVVPGIARLFGPLGKRFASMNSLSLTMPHATYSNAQSWHACLSELAGPALRPGLEHDRVACRAGRPLGQANATIVQRLLFDDFQVQLPDAYLTKVDVASMAASLEVRAPMLDVAVLEAAWRLPDRMKIHWGQRKWILKRIAARHVPGEVIYRPKQGFAMPLQRWFQAELGVLLEGLLADSTTAREGWLDKDRVMRDLRGHRAGTHDNHTRLWLVLWLELWFRIVVSGALSKDADLAEMLSPCES